MRSKMSSRAASSSIYWDSVESSGSGSSGSAGSRNYVDPWDLENYAYLRRHSIAAASVAGCTPQPIYQTNTRYGSRISHHSPLESDYWYAPNAIREPGYDAPASVEEIYFRPQRPVSSGCYYHQQPIYEDESTMSHYAAPIPLYSHLSELEQAEALEELRTREMLRRRSKVARSRNNYTRDECLYHRRPSEMRYTTLAAPSRSRLYAEEEEESVDEVEAVRYREPIKPTHITLNTYGHLKIDYTNSWNSLHRKIVSN
ncbi:uncharacterized protein LOC100678925 [Nasonia vitripennis]|uniref:Uncharacterized protein n=1 Tax=Nasonia vitripennis TaxID=7425 RepID=A0A7M7LVA8_NASVI|nr:uncharacterized protein LOC100678925 [Nasonia vitripennis]